MSNIFLIVGLGNPGVEYSLTNHNIGFMCADFLSAELNFSQFKSKFDCLYSEKILEKKSADNKKEQHKIIILKPQTFMNSSGNSVQKLVQFYKISSANVVVIHDDLDLKPGDIRIKFSGSSGGHNGIKSIDNAIGSDYWRIRIGIGRPENKEYPINNYVLSKISSALKEILPKVFKSISKNINDFLTETFPKSKAISKIKSDAKSY